MIDKKEVLRYLRTYSGVEDPALHALIDNCISKAYACVKPKTIYQIFECFADEDGGTVEGLRFESRRLAQTLSGCRRLVAIAATLGTEADRLLRTAKAESAAELMIYQAVLAAMTEEVCDELEKTIVAETGFRLRKRYSPGYFDLALTSQKDFFELMDITKRIGITLTDTMLMVPSKSVTALIGIEDEN